MSDNTLANGHTTVTANGYSYTKVDDGEWRLTHHIIAEQSIGRPIRKGRERVVFKDKDRTNLSPGNIEVVPISKKSTRLRIAALKVKIEELQAEIAELEEELEDGS